MDYITLSATTRALDIAIATVVKNQLEELASKAGPEQTVHNILRSLRSFEGLQKDIMPAYDEWDAVFYSAWYQPGHINLAYTLIGKIPIAMNPLLSGQGNLHVIDFGCGALAMQFGLALAAADTLQEQGELPQINISSKDSSRYMVAIGQKIWAAFVREITHSEKYPELNTLRQVCGKMTFENYVGNATVRWLSVLHVAYRENANEVENALATRIKEERIDLVIVTSHPGSASFAFSPVPYGYSTKGSDILRGEDFSLQGNFQHITQSRSGVYDKFVQGSSELTPTQNGFARRYLTGYPTDWVTPFFKTQNSLYVRNPAGGSGYYLYDLPF